MFCSVNSYKSKGGNTICHANFGTHLLQSMLIAVMVAGCGGGAAPADPTSTPVIVNPPVIKEDQPTSTPRPTAVPEPEETDEPDLPVTEEFQINGVTMPFNR